MCDHLERSFCLCLGCTGDVLLYSVVASLLLHSMGVFPLSMEVFLSHLGLVHQLSGSELLGLDLATGAGLAPQGSFSLS